MFTTNLPKSLPYSYISFICKIFTLPHRHKLKAYNRGSPFSRTRKCIAILYLIDEESGSGGTEPSFAGIEIVSEWKLNDWLWFSSLLLLPLPCGLICNQLHCKWANDLFQATTDSRPNSLAAFCRSQKQDYRGRKGRGRPSLMDLGKCITVRDFHGSAFVPLPLLLQQTRLSNIIISSTSYGSSCYQEKKWRGIRDRFNYINAKW